MTITSEGRYYVGQCKTCLTCLKVDPAELFELTLVPLPDIGAKEVEPRQLPREGRVRCPKCHGITIVVI